MATFPTLKTGAVAQYPASRNFRFQNQILRFLDGTDQRYRDSAGVLYSWEIRLDQLDETEMAELQAFFLANQGGFASFDFTDPWSGQAYQNCSLASDDMNFTSLAEMQGRTSLVVIQNRG
jgi:phage-related protein